MKGMLSKVSKSSFKRRSYQSLSNNDPDRLLGHYLEKKILFFSKKFILLPKQQNKFSSWLDRR